MPLDRLKDKTTKENLWLYILTLLKRKHMYAYEISEEIKKEFKFEIGTVTAYIILYKLENEGYVKTTWVLKDNRQRKYYEITPDGTKILNNGVRYLKDLTRKLG